MAIVESTPTILGAAVLAIGVPLAIFHHKIATELRHLRAHFLGASHGKTGRPPHHHR